MRWIFFIACLGLYSCSLAPHYKSPAMRIPGNYKETGKWLKVDASTKFIRRNQPWWTLFHDKTLNALEEQVTCHNQNLKVALAHFMQARAYAQSLRSELYPSLTGIGTVARQQNAKRANVNAILPNLLYNTFMLGVYLSYEVDVWGKVRNAVKAGDNIALASEFTLASTDLSLHAELAKDYFALRGYDDAQRMLDRRVIAYQKALFLTKQRHIGGIDPIASVDQAQVQLENAKTLATETRLKRAKVEHAIAVLIGETPASFSIQPKKVHRRKIIVLPNLPSQLLQRRPDIASAESRVRAANATIGVAEAAFFPEFNFIGIAGYNSLQLNNLFSAPSLFWSLGPSTALSLIQPEISQVLFDGFKLHAQLKYAKASYFETVSQYRQTVLTAFQEVENALVSIHRLDEEDKTQSHATNSANDAWYQDRLRLKGGIITFLNVVITENQALEAELALIDIQTRRQISYVELIKALGGGWCIEKT